MELVVVPVHGEEHLAALVAAFSGLRWGELAALRRSDIDLPAGTVKVPRKLAALRNRLEFGPPKSETGVRTVALPEAHWPRCARTSWHTSSRTPRRWCSPAPRARRCGASVKAAGIPGDFHFHDLRHTGNTLAAASGASTRELMQRMGHASMRVALIYQHATSERDREIAAGMDRRIADQTGKKPAKRKRRRKKGDDGTAGQLARISQWHANGTQDRR